MNILRMITQKDEPTGYNIPRPLFPTLTGVSAGIVTGGVVGLGVIFYSEMRLFQMDILPAALLSAAVEYCNFNAGLSVVRKKNWLALIETVIGLVGSGVVNFLHFTAMNNQIITKTSDPVLIAILSVAPLAVIFSSSLWIAVELREWEARVRAWEADRDNFIRAQAEQADANAKEAQRLEQEAKERQADAFRADRIAQANADRERAERERQAVITANKEIELARIASQERENKRANRLERSRIEQEQRANVPAVVPTNGANVPGTVPPTKGTYQEYRAFLQANGANHTRAELARRFNVSERAITKWNSKLANEQPAVITIEAN